MEAQIEKSQTLALTRLYDAALKGDVPSLLNLLGEDPLILKRCVIGKSGSFTQSPLHVAANFGYSNFTKEIIKHKPELVELVDQIKRSSPLHIASAKGHLQIVEALLGVKSSVCFTYDQDGMTPVHVAAINGNTDVLHALLRVEPQAAWELTKGGQTVLHLCVKHNQLEALKILVKATDDELLNFEDSRGNTVLHLAVAAKHPEMVQFLTTLLQKIEINAINKKGLTAVDIHKQRADLVGDAKFLQYLKDAKALPAKEALKPKKDRAWLENQRTSLMVVASLIATMAFQVGINPPGGVWQETIKYNKKEVQETGNDNSHRAGLSVWSYGRGFFDYNYVLVSNTIGLLSSLSVILLLISGLPCKRFFLFILRITLWIAVSATAWTYMLSVFNLTYDGVGVYIALTCSLKVWQALIVAILMMHLVRFIWKKISWQKRQSILKFCKRCYPRLANTTNESNLSNPV